MTGQTHLTKIIRHILNSNFVQIDDNIDRSDLIEQTNGVLQGDPLSPLLFNIETSDITKAIHTDNVKIYA